MTAVIAHRHMHCSVGTKVGGVWGNDESAVRALATPKDQGLSPHVEQPTPAGLTGTWGHRRMHTNI